MTYVKSTGIHDQIPLELTHPRIQHIKHHKTSILLKLKNNKPTALRFGTYKVHTDY